MEAKELRIGNYVIDHLGRTQRVAETRSDSYICYLRNGAKLKYKLNTTKPIPLTEEWLFKFGFKKQGVHYTQNLLSIDLKSEIYPNGRTYFNSWKIKDGFPKYVHQLQNLYFALIGEELTLTNPDYLGD